MCSVKKVFLISSIAVLFLSTFSWAQKGTTTRIEIIDDTKDLSNTELRRRIRRLQDAVIDLQERVERLEDKLGTSGSPDTKVTCFLETPFDGVFDATEINETKARVEAVKACMSKVKSRIHCAADKVKCGK